MKSTQKQNEVITGIIKELGIPTNVKGYYYIRYAILLMINDMTLVNNITKTLYPNVAKEFNTKPSRVERAMRHAIEVGWSRANINCADKLFGYSVDANKGKPTNSEFITTVADYILLSD